MRYLVLALLTPAWPPTLVNADPYVRPIPQAQSATAELWFLIASLALIAALWGVHKLVTRR